MRTYLAKIGFDDLNKHEANVNAGRLVYQPSFIQITNIEPENGIIEVYLTGVEDKEAIIQALEIGPMSEFEQGRKN